MATFTKQLLSGSTNGKPIQITAQNNAAAQTVHTATSSLALDEIWLYASNSSTSNLQLNLLWGGTSEPANLIVVTVPAQSGRTLVSDGMLLNNLLLVKAYCPTSSLGSLLLDGFVNNIA